MFTPCDRCLHFKDAPPPLRLFATSQDRSVGGIKAERQVLDAEARMRGEERRRVEDPNYSFNYRPDYYAWCARYTCTPEQVEELTRALLDDEQATLQKARESGMAFAVNPVRGRVERIFVICSRRNKGHCDGFERVPGARP
jgi:hypothetical protein